MLIETPRLTILNLSHILVRNCIGAETLTPLPLNQWVHLAVVFENRTTPDSDGATTAASDDTSAGDALTTISKHQEQGLVVSHPLDYYQRGVSAASAAGMRKTARASAATGASQYSVAVYVNGKLDVRMDFTDPVVGNPHSAMFFKDVSFAGKLSMIVVGLMVCEYYSCVYI
jgi:hypothetical protein